MQTRKIDWSADGGEICRLIDDGGAHTTHRRRSLIIAKARPQTYSARGAAPGTIVNIDDDGCPSIALSERTVLIEELFRRGRVIEAADIRFRLGDRLC